MDARTLLFSIFSISIITTGFIKAADTGNDANQSNSYCAWVYSKVSNATSSPYYVNTVTRIKYGANSYVKGPYNFSKMLNVNKEFEGPRALITFDENSNLIIKSMYDSKGKSPIYLSDLPTQFTENGEKTTHFHKIRSQEVLFTAHKKQNYKEYPIHCLSFTTLYEMNNLANSKKIIDDDGNVLHSHWVIDDHKAPSYDMLSRAVEEIDKRDTQDNPIIIVHCREGKGRSATVTAAYFLSLFIKGKKFTTDNNLEIKKEFSAEEAVSAVITLMQGLRTVVAPNAEQRDALIDFYKKETEKLKRNKMTTAAAIQALTVTSEQQRPATTQTTVTTNTIIPLQTQTITISPQPQQDDGNDAPSVLTTPMIVPSVTPVDAAHQAPQVNNVSIVAPEQRTPAITESITTHATQTKIPKATLVKTDNQPKQRYAFFGLFNWLRNSLWNNSKNTAPIDSKTPTTKKPSRVGALFNWIWSYIRIF